jgi:hypothetical protein
VTRAAKRGTTPHIYYVFAIDVHSTVQTSSTINSLGVPDLTKQLIVEQILLPCQCVLMWSNNETKVVLCQLHAREYVGWEGNDEEFIKVLTTEHSHQMKTFDRREMERMR